MNKDVIYIDVEDDITTIIGKIKASEEKIVALVPPKHVGVLQSAVNLRLLERMAKNEKKNLVIVTNNQALVALSASARIPVAKNLQSKPELAEIPALAVDDGDDIIDGAELPVGDHAGKKGEAAESRHEAAEAPSARQLHHKPSRTDTLSDLEIDDQPVEEGAAAAVAVAGTKRATKAKTGPKIPNFNKFRKRLFLGVLAGVLVIAALVWAFVFAPAATVTITAATLPTQVSGTIKLGGTSATDYKSGVVSSESQQLQKNVTVQFTPTGQKDEGTPATGTVTFSTNYISALGTTIPAGTQLTSTGGYTFTTDSAVTMTSNNYTGANVGVTAVANGTSYNGVTGSMSGAPSGINAKMSTASSGGTTNIVTVVSDSDIQQAESGASGQSTDAIQKQLTSQFKNGEIVIPSSFASSQGSPSSSPASGQPLPSGTTQATLTIPMTYTIYAFPKDALNTYLNASLTSQLTDANNQRIYDNGLSKVGFSNFSKDDSGNFTVNLTTTGQVGPKIDPSVVKNAIKGMVTGSVQSTLEAISGVRDVNVTYSYFWVNKIPNNPNKTTIEFKITNG